MSNRSAILGPADRCPRAETDVEPGVSGEAVAVDCTDDGPVGHDREKRDDRAGRDRSCQAPAFTRGGLRLGRFIEIERQIAGVSGVEQNERACQGDQVKHPFCDKPLGLERDDRTLEVENDDRPE
jgi:hypothetical protein